MMTVIKSISCISFIDSASNVLLYTSPARHLSGSGYILKSLQRHVDFTLMSYRVDQSPLQNVQARCFEKDFSWIFNESSTRC